MILSDEIARKQGRHVATPEIRAAIDAAEAKRAVMAAAAPEMFEALKRAREFIANGIEFGFIRMPDADTPDPAHGTLPAIDAALSKASPATAAKTGGE